MSRVFLHRQTALATLAAAATVAALALSGCSSSSPTLAHSTSSSTTPPDASLTTPSASGASTTSTPSRTVAPTASTASPATIKPPSTATTVPSATAGLPQLGSAGPAVLQLQQSLTTLGYWLGTPDGHFGGTTQQAVWALQKAAGVPRSGLLDSATAAALSAGTRPSAMSSSGHVIEVDLARNLLLFVTNGHVDTILNTSTGGGYVYYDQGSRNVALTPKGHFATYRVIEGQHRSSLGLLFRPRFFTGGFAIHGDSYVPPRPVSHGCVRITDAAINWVWATNVDPIGTPVWVY